MKRFAILDIKAYKQLQLRRTKLPSKLQTTSKKTLLDCLDREETSLRSFHQDCKDCLNEFIKKMEQGILREKKVHEIYIITKQAVDKIEVRY